MVQYVIEMGQNSSLPKGRRKSLRSFPKKAGTRKNSLSHTFALNDNDDKIDRLNINIASEEELMTLDGVTREIAKSIVEHRKAIGRFRKVEDLAVVRGIGADKLQYLRPEICVSSRRNQNSISSRAQSYDSLRSTESRATLKSNRLVNINKASIFELQAINGVTQEIAAAIIHYRNKKGNFRQVEDLLKIKYLDYMQFYNMSRYLTADDEDDFFDIEDSRPSILTNGFTKPSHNGQTYSLPKRLSITNGLTNSSTTDIFELLSAYSPRPVIQEIFRFSRDDKPAIRMASWNLHEFSFEKSNNLGVKEVICRTILENGFSLIAVQDVVNATALRTICEELNTPRVQRVKEWGFSKHHNWNFCMLDVHDSKLGFIYDGDGGTQVIPTTNLNNGNRGNIHEMSQILETQNDSEQNRMILKYSHLCLTYEATVIDLLSLNKGPEEANNECEALVATFRVGNLNLQLVNLILNRGADVEILNQKFKDLTSEGDFLMVFIDYTNVRVSDEHLSIGNLKPMLSRNANTTFMNNLHKGETHTSNILHNAKVQRQLTGTNGIIKQGLVHLAIPNGWSWGGPVSPYCPIYTELFVNLVDDTNL